MKRMKCILNDGVGFAVLDCLPMDRYAIESVLAIYWILGQCIGRPVAQKWNGQMIYDVTDTGEAYAYGTRGSHTSVELNFHTNNSFVAPGSGLRRAAVQATCQAWRRGVVSAVFMRCISARSHNAQKRWGDSINRFFSTARTNTMKVLLRFV